MTFFKFKLVTKGLFLNKTLYSIITKKHLFGVIYNHKVIAQITSFIYGVGLSLAVLVFLSTRLF